MHESGQLNRRDFLKTATAGAVGLGLTNAGARELFAVEGEPDLVRKRPLGKTGLNVSVIAFGCGGLSDAGLPLLRKAHESGINLYDTASGYGNGRSEEALGKFLKGLEDRESVHVVTKASGFRTPRGSSKEVLEAFRERITQHLKRLQTDYIDVYYWPHGATSLAATRNEACRDALSKLKKEGLIRHVGTSSHSNYAKVCEDAIEEGFYEVLMPVANLCTQNPDGAGLAVRGRRRWGRNIDDTRKALRDAKRRKVGLVAMKAANNGFLGTNTDELLKREFPDETGLSRHQKLYSYMLRQEGVSSVVVGIHSASHLMEAIEIGRA